MSRAPAQRQSVVYATNDDAQHLHMLLGSIDTLRAHDSKVSIIVAASPQLPGPVLAVLRRRDAAVVPLSVPRWSMKGISERQRATFLKWFALGQIGPKFDRVIYADGDTAWFSSPRALFRRLRLWDFAAREDLGKQRHRRAELIGSFLALPEVDWRVVAKTREALQSSTLDLPIFNTGVMAVGRRCARWVAQRLPVMEKLCQLWCDGEIPYPSTNRWVMEEVAASIMLSTMSSLLWRRLTPRESPLYIELRAKVVKDPGTVVHIWSQLYPFFLEDFRGRPARRRFENRFLDMADS
jgi:hypothetical protein